MTSLDGLRTRVDGDVVGPGDRGYDDRRAVFGAREDRRPAVIVVVASTADVAEALAFGRATGRRVLVRGTGWSGAATGDDVVVVDVSRLNHVRVDAAARTAVAGGGLTWGEFDEATQEHGLAVTGGRVSGLGVAGVALGEGSGWLERALGPTAASLIEAEVVLPDGSLVRAGPAEHADLLETLRGGGGAGAGVVTELTFALHEVGPTLLCGFLSYRRERAADVIRAYRDQLAEAPDGTIGGLTLFAGRAGACTVAFGHVGDIAEGERLAEPLRALSPSLDAVMPNEYRAFQAMTDLHSPWGMRAHRTGGLLSDLTDAAVDRLVAAADAPASALSRVSLWPLGGAVARPDTSWRYECVGLWPPLPALDPGELAWVAGVEEALTAAAA